MTRLLVVALAAAAASVAVSRLWDAQRRAEVWSAHTDTLTRS